MQVLRLGKHKANFYYPDFLNERQALDKRPLNITSTDHYIAQFSLTAKRLRLLKPLFFNNVKQRIFIWETFQTRVFLQLLSRKINPIIYLQWTILIHDLILCIYEAFRINCNDSQFRCMCLKHAQKFVS